MTGSHSTKVGVTLMHQWRFTTQEVNNSVALVVRGRQPFSLTQYATPIQYHETVNYNMGIFAQDQWTVKRLTANYGVRIDFLKSAVDPQDIAAGPFTPARHYDGIEAVPNWKDISPRFGVAYDLFGNGKTAVKASVGRYVVADAYTIARAVNPMFSTINQTTRTWNATTTYNPFNDCNLRNPLANGSCGPMAQPTFGTQVAPTTTYDPAIVNGWGVRPFNWEMQFSVQQEVAPRVSVYVGYSRRSFGNLFATKNNAVTNASYTPYCIGLPTAPSITGQPVPNGGSQQCGYFDLIRPTTPNNVVQSADNFGGVEDVFDGIDFDVNARLSRGIIVSGGVSIGRERTNSCSLKDDLSRRVPERRRRGSRQRRRRAGAADGCVLRRSSALPAERQRTAHLSVSLGNRLVGELPKRSRCANQRPVSADQHDAWPHARPPVLERRADRGHRRARHAVPRSRLPDRHPVSEDAEGRFDDDPSDRVDLQPVQREPDEHEPGVHRAVWLGMAGPDGDSDAAVHRFRRPDRLLEWYGGRWLGGRWIGHTAATDHRPLTTVN